MKFSPVSCLLAALCSATSTLAHALHESPSPALAYYDAEATPAPELVNDQPKLEVRQQDVEATTAVIDPAQYPSITTQWIESTIASTTTWVEVIYTQTFAPVPEQWYTAGAGTIGYGTLTKDKRDVQARQTGYVQSVVLALQTEVVTQYLRPVTEVLILETITILPNMTYNIITNGNSSNGTVSRNHMLPVNANNTLNNTLNTGAYRVPTAPAPY